MIDSDIAKVRGVLDLIPPGLISVGDVEDALSRIGARLEETERLSENRRLNALHWLGRFHEIRTREKMLRDALDWIEAEPEDPAKVQARARAALAEKPE